MAKKPLTPEQAEIKAMKKAKKSENWTKFWAILLAAVLTFAVVSMGKTAAEDAIEKAKEQNQTENVDSNNTSNNGGTSTDPFANSGSNSGTTDNSGATNNGGTTDNSGATNNGSTTDNGPSKADVVKIFNDTTAKAAKGSYKVHREGKFTKDIDVGNATSALDGIIKGVDENASLNSVVGGFLGLNKPVDADIKNGKGDEGFNTKYALKAMALTENDVDSVKVDGNKYMIKVKRTVTPDANSALAHATNDYITFAEVNKSINEAVGTAVVVEESGSEAIYDNIVFTATVVDGKLTNLEYSYTFSAKLALKIAIMKATGTGEAEITGTYSNIQY